jgi:replicative DNA helicase
VWGDDTRVLWSAGEPLIVAGPPGVGKSTLVQQVALRRIGLHSRDLLGLTVEPHHDHAVLYLALDRPAQIRRSMRRMVRPIDRGQLDALLKVRTALPFDPIRDIGGLAAMCVSQGARTLVIDSLYNLVPRLTDDESVHGLQQSLRAVLSAGIEVAIVHHNRKPTSDNKNPTKAADLYGSRFIEAMAGSIIMLAGDAGDEQVLLHHRKQPAEQVGPLDLEHDHTTGSTTALVRPTVDQALREHGRQTVKQLTARVFGAEDRKLLQRVRRRCEQLVKTGDAVRHEVVGGEVEYELRGGACQPVPASVPARNPARPGTQPVNTGHATGTHQHAAPNGAPARPHLESGGRVPGSAPASNETLDELAAAVLATFPGSAEVPASD